MNYKSAFQVNVGRNLITNFLYVFNNKYFREKYTSVIVKRTIQG